MIVYTIKEGVPAKPPHMYTEDDFKHYENLKNGYKSHKPLLSVMKAVYDAEGRLVGHKKDSMYDPFLQTIQNKVYFAKSKEWTMAKRSFITTHFHAPTTSSSSSSTTAYLPFTSTASIE